MTDPGLDRTNEAPEAPAPSNAFGPWGFVRELPVLIIIAFAVALIIKSFVLQAFFIPSASMEPTLREGDRVLVEKISYALGNPERGHVIVFERDVAPIVPVAPPEPSLRERLSNAGKELFGFSTGSTQDYIKRVVAIEGDTVLGRDGKLFVNEAEVEEPYLTEGKLTSDFGPIHIPEDHVFVMGDNRDNSDDSRGFGPVPEDRIVGHAFVLIWPPVDVSTL